MGKTGLAALKSAASQGTSSKSDRPDYLKILPDTSVTGRFLQELDKEAANYNEDAGLGELFVLWEDPDNFQRKIADTTEEEGRAWPAEQGWRPKQKLYIAFLVEESSNKDDIGKVFILNQGFGPKSVTLPLVEYADDYGTICDRPYRVKRTGSGRMDTSYTLIPLREDAEPFDVSPFTDDIPEWDTVVRHVPYAQQEAFFTQTESATADKVTW